MKATSVSVTGDTWKALDSLRKETGISKRRLVELAVKHLADCEEAKSALDALGFDVEAIVKAIEDTGLRKFYLSVPAT